MLKSSLDNWNLQYWSTEQLSFMQKLNNEGPKTDPYGTPLETALQTDLFSPSQTRVLLERQDWTRAINTGPRPIFLNFANIKE